MLDVGPSVYALGRPRQEDGEFKASLSYLESPGQPEVLRKTDLKADRQTD